MAMTLTEYLEFAFSELLWDEDNCQRVLVRLPAFGLEVLAERKNDEDYSVSVHPLNSRSFDLTSCAIYCAHEFGKTPGLYSKRLP